MRGLDNLLLIALITILGLTFYKYGAHIVGFYRQLSLRDSIFLLFHLIEITVISMLAAYVMSIKKASESRDAVNYTKLQKLIHKTCTTILSLCRK